MKDIKEESHQMSIRGRDTVQSGATLLKSAAHKQQEYHKLQRFFPKREGPKPYIKLPSLWVLHWEDKPPEHLALKANGFYFWEIQRTVGNRDSTLKGANKMSYTLETQGQSSNLQRSRLRSTC